MLTVDQYSNTDMQLISKLAISQDSYKFDIGLLGLESQDKLMLPGLPELASLAVICGKKKISDLVKDFGLYGWRGGW